MTWPAGDRLELKVDKMTNKLLFGQRIAHGWRALVEHLNNVSAQMVEIEDSQLRDETSGDLSQPQSGANSGPAGLPTGESIDG